MLNMYHPYPLISDYSGTDSYFLTPLQTSTIVHLHVNTYGFLYGKFKMREPLWRHTYVFTCKWSVELVCKGVNKLESVPLYQCNYVRLIYLEFPQVFEKKDPGTWQAHKSSMKRGEFKFLLWMSLKLHNLLQNFQHAVTFL